ncbi:MAG: FKBP-type peptidyl-prolyl cis-trans isomerase [Balneolaceae bacterium]
MNPLIRHIPVFAGLLLLLPLSACMDTTGSSEYHYDNTPDLEYLEENRDKEGVEETESGLQYRELEAGDEEGEKPTANSTVRIHYTGWFVDGSIFDTTKDTNQPLEYPVNGFIDGWIEGLQLMSVGSNYEFVIPAKLAYGEEGARNQNGVFIVPPGATLIFEVELLAIL